MKVKEIIELLQKENPEARLVVDGYESGFDEAYVITHVTIKQNSNKEDDRWWNGEFEFNEEDGSEIAILIPRKS